MFKEQIQQEYLLFKKGCNNNKELTVLFLKQMKKDEILEQLIGMKELTEFEKEYIHDLLESK